jgi:hypothetical protein
MLLFSNFLIIVVNSRFPYGWGLRGVFPENTIPFAVLTLCGCIQAVAKTSAAPIERIKLLVQNQDEMVLSFDTSPTLF